MLSSLGECEQVMLLVQGDIKLSSRFFLYTIYH